MAPFAHRLRPRVTRAPLRFRACVPGEGSGLCPGHGPVAAGALQIQGASSGRLGGPRTGSGAESRRLWAPGVRPGRAATTLGGRGRLGVGTGRGRGSSSPFRRPSSRLPRPLFPGRPARPPAGPFTFKQSYEVAVATAPGAQRGQGRRAHPPARPRLAGPGAGHAPGTRPAGHTPVRPPEFRASPARDSAAAPDRESGAGPRLSEGWRGWRRRPSPRAALSEYREDPGGVAGAHPGTPDLPPPQSWKGRGGSTFPSIFIPVFFSELAHRC